MTITQESGAEGRESCLVQRLREAAESEAQAADFHSNPLNDGAGEEAASFYLDRANLLAAAANALSPSAPRVREALEAIASNDQTNFGRIWCPQEERWVGVRQFALAALSGGGDG